jgi:predicted transcriptional regulator of viral defense system
MLVLKARGNVVTLKLKTLCGERRAAMALLRKLTDTGYLKRIGDGKYLLQKGSPLWEALEQGRADQLLKQLHNQQKKSILQNNTIIGEGENCISVAVCVYAV